MVNNYELRAFVFWHSALSYVTQYIAMTCNLQVRFTLSMTLRMQVRGARSRFLTAMLLDSSSLMRYAVPIGKHLTTFRKLHNPSKRRYLPVDRATHQKT